MTWQLEIDQLRKCEEHVRRTRANALPGMSSPLGKSAIAKAKAEIHGIARELINFGKTTCLQVTMQANFRK